jgi:hypothetical protein
MDHYFWLELARVVLRLRRPCPLSKFKSAFKLPPQLVDFLFRKVKKSYSTCRPKHFLWTLYYLKTSMLGEESIATALGTIRSTLRLYVELTLKWLDATLPEVLLLLFISSNHLCIFISLFGDCYDSLFLWCLFSLSFFLL